MAKSCKGLAVEVVKCLGESDSVKVENRSYRECVGEKSPCIPTSVLDSWKHISIAREAREVFTFDHGQGTLLKSSLKLVIFMILYPRVDMRARIR
ncbi:hypothetical protein VNO78_31217 [Psophocarpus tetragonolobus]|uniref:Uncharacterized protein n=1 Tax=Psophocarpus tetragonolobus TaxID=3891 RepID=A0AAN9RY17_PSOTE